MDSYDPYRPKQADGIAPSYMELSATGTAALQDQDTSYSSLHKQTTRYASLQEQDTRYSSGPDDDAASKLPSSDSDENLTLAQGIKRYPKVVGYCLALTVAIIGWGYDLVVVGSVTGVDSFKEDFGARFDGKLIIPSFWLSLWLALPPAGSVGGDLMGGWLQDAVGRKRSLFTGSVVSAIAIACIFFSYLPQGQNAKRAMLTAGLTVQGFSVGVIKTTCITYVSENAPTSLRGPAMALFPTFTLLGQLIGSIVVYVVNGIEGSQGYRAAFASQWGMAIAPFVISIVMPDSPAYLIRKGLEQKALRSAKRLYAPKVSPYSMLEKIRATINEERALAANVSYWACFKGTNLRRTLIVIMANSFPMLFGLDLLSNASIFLQTVGMASSTSLLLMIAGIVAGMVSNGIGIWVLSRAGRRTITMVSMGTAGVLWGVMGVSGFFSSPAAIWLAGGLMIAIIIVCGMGCWPAGYAIMGETSSLQLRAPTQGLGGVASQISSIAMALALPYIFNSDAGNLGAKTGFVYTGLCLIGVIICWFCLPELKGRSTLEVDHMFAMKLPTRKFKTWKMEEHELQEASPLATSGA
ncbi:hypothetical protein AK830_g7023 [Neonectria ditissima]|uniref:Major facilitator superfamily (MFS) profile domain-containing protein n=1 Tax=Neonectria ditissima TaxID=78410 RepID=A0A0P7ANZ5_9HYPO|nr:hypothetical protein AK830_g7023 [Neonectria ditissima]